MLVFYAQLPRERMLNRYSGKWEDCSNICKTITKFAAAIIQISHREMKKQSETEISTSVYEKS